MIRQRVARIASCVTLTRTLSSHKKQRVAQNAFKGYVFHRHQTSARIVGETAEFELYNKRRTRMTTVIATLHVDVRSSTARALRSSRLRPVVSYVHRTLRQASQNSWT